MDEDIPICMITLSGNEIVSYNVHLKKEFENLKIYAPIEGDIKKYIPDFYPGMLRAKSILVIDSKTLYCVVSHYKKYVILEQIPYTKPLIRFNSQEIKPNILNTIEITENLYKLCNTQEQYKYIDSLKRNNIHLLKTINNTIEYLKIASGSITPTYEDIYLSSIIDAVKKTIPVEVSIELKRDVIITTDFKKLIEMCVHILSYSVTKTKIVKKKLKISLNSGKLIFIFIDTTGKLSRYQSDMIFHGFIHNDIKGDYSSLLLPIAKGLSISLGGDLSILHGDQQHTMYKFSIPTKDF